MQEKETLMRIFSFLFKRLERLEFGFSVAEESQQGRNAYAMLLCHPHHLLSEDGLKYLITHVY